jgi:putative DNA primase/helicase
MRGAELCGLLAEEQEKTEATFKGGFRDGMRDTRERPLKPTDDPNARGEVLRGLALTDYGNAQRLIRLHGADLRHCYEFGYWLYWTGTHWIVDLSAAERRAKDAVLKIYDEVKNLDDDQEREMMVAHATRSEGASRIVAMLALAKSEPGIPVKPDDLDRDDWLFNCANGTLDLRTGEFREHRREDLITRVTTAVYMPGATCPRWLAFLNRVMASNTELIIFLQRAVGYSLTGSTAERCLIILHGAGMNGKSVLVEVLRMLHGDYAARTPTQTLMAKHGDTIPNDIARLKGVRFVSASETGEGKTLDESTVKDLTGGERVSARFMRGEWFEFTPKFKIFLSTNHKPKVNGRDDAIWDRIRLVPFNVRITPSEQRPMSELLAEFREELPGILAWAVQGCLDWQAHGLGAPACVVEATAAYRNEMDVLGDFIEECCRVEPDAAVLGRELYDAYKMWAGETGERVMSQRMFSLRMGERGRIDGFQKHHGRDGRFWSGIVLSNGVGAVTTLMRNIL